MLKQKRSAKQDRKRGGRIMHISFRRNAVFMLLLLTLSCFVMAADLYKLGSGDVLSITVWERPDLKTEVAVGPDGRIAIPLAGQIDVENHSLEEVENIISERLKQFILDPLVTVQILKYRTFRVQVLGEVAKPGFYNMEPGSTVLDALAISGGPLTAADLYNVQLGDEKLDVNEVLKNTQLDKKLLPGTTIYVPEARPVLVLGEIAHPGSYIYQDGLTLLSVLTQAGGPTQAANLSAVMVGEEAIDVKSIMADNQADIQLKAGTTIYVPQIRPTLVLGAVKNPGSYSPKEGQTILEVIALSGGLLANGNQNNIRLERKDEVFEGSLKELGTLKIEQGDVVIIPEWQEVLVMGEVMRPGSYKMAKGQKLLDIIGLAGGFSTKADYKATVRKEDDFNIIDIGLAVKDPQHNSNIALSGGEVIFIPESKDEIVVIGEVQKPGSYAFRVGDDLASIIAAAGGVTNKANITQIEIKSGTEIKSVMLGHYPLSGNEVIIVHEVAQVTILGEVTRPGTYSIGAAGRLIDVVAMAGGPTKFADLGNIHLYRGGDGSQGTKISVGKDKLIFVGSAKENPEVYPGDVIYVYRNNKIDWSQVATYLSIIGSLSSLVKAWL